MTDFHPLPLLLTLSVIILGAAVLLTLVRLYKGPGMPDRVVALDLLSVLGMGLIGVYAIMARQDVFLDAAGILALISFIGTVAYARHFEKKFFEKKQKGYYDT